jgi:hypothetical protein
VDISLHKGDDLYIRTSHDRNPSIADMLIANGIQSSFDSVKLGFIDNDIRHPTKAGDMGQIHLTYTCLMLYHYFLPHVICFPFNGKYFSEDFTLNDYKRRNTNRG